MKDKTLPLFAIYKNDVHLGNQRGASENDAIKNYVVESKFKSFLSDSEFMNKYKALLAIETVHYYKSKYIIYPPLARGSLPRAVYSFASGKLIPPLLVACVKRRAPLRLL
jgi:hypothetical protein